MHSSKESARLFILHLRKIRNFKFNVILIFKFFSISSVIDEMDLEIVVESLNGGLNGNP